VAEVSWVPAGALLGPPGDVAGGLAGVLLEDEPLLLSFPHPTQPTAIVAAPVARTVRRVAGWVM
jgi:hypothetical protein